MAAIVDLPDGSFVLRPDPKRVLQLRLIVGASSVVVFGAGVAFVALGIKTGQIPWPVFIVVFLIFGATEWFFWNAIKPPTLRANALEVTASQTLLKQRMLRSDLEFIFRGQIFAQTRSASYWSKTYLFVGPGGRVAIKVPASEVITDDMAEFAQRLQVPIRGDFSAQVKDRVDPTST
jgi:hypothetical protein